MYECSLHMPKFYPSCINGLYFPLFISAAVFVGYWCAHLQIYNFFDDCGPGNQLHVDVSAEASFGKIRNGTNGAIVAVGTFSELRRRFAQPVPGGGQAYPCGTGRAAAAWCNNDDARAGINMKPLSFYGRPWTSQAGVGMHYDHYTGASFDLYPDIVKRYRTVIYNGDVDACVPYNSNEDWTVALAAQQGWQELEAWRPWTVNDIPAGYVTSYGTPGPANFTFLTVKNSGHSTFNGSAPVRHRSLLPLFCCLYCTTAVALLLTPDV